MYCVEILNKGKFDNWSVGKRYCLTTNSAATIIAHAMVCECDFSFSKLTRLHDDVFSWTSYGIPEKIWKKVNKIIKEEKTL